MAEKTDATVTGGDGLTPVHPTDVPTTPTPARSSPTSPCCHHMCVDEYVTMLRQDLDRIYAAWKAKGLACERVKYGVVVQVGDAELDLLDIEQALNDLADKVEAL